jgi:hypothetical protein
MGENLIARLGRLILSETSPEAESALARTRALVDDCIEPQEGTTTYEEDVRGGYPDALPG